MFICLRCKNGSEEDDTAGLSALSSVISVSFEHIHMIDDNGYTQH